MRRRWLFIPLVAVALAFVITGGAAVAQSGDSDSDSTVGKFAERVASILGLEASQVQDAMEQASTELKDERVQSKLDSLVEDGTITQEQADEYKTWWDERPDGAFMRFHFRKLDADDLDSLVESGKITQEQADAYTEYAEWLEARPDWVDSLARSAHSSSGRWGFKGSWGSHGGGFHNGNCDGDSSSTETTAATGQA